MSDQVQRRTRPQGMPLRAAPDPAPPLDQPSVLGGLMGQKPTATLGSQVGRWYENAGGLDRAIDSAQKAQANRDEDVLDGGMWPKWKPSDVTERKATVSYTDKLEPGTFGSALLRPSWFPVPAHIELDKRPHKGDQATLEHELGHVAFARDSGTFTGQAAAVRKNQDRWSAADGHPFADTPEYAAYLMDPSETDVRLAEVKRHYAHHTGRIADSPEESRKAWDWYRSQQPSFEPEAQPGVERPGESPTMTPGQFEFYDSLPESAKEQMMHRMPELVQRNVLGGLRGRRA